MSDTAWTTPHRPNIDDLNVSPETRQLVVAAGTWFVDELLKHNWTFEVMQSRWGFSQEQAIELADAVVRFNLTQARA